MSQSPTFVCAKAGALTTLASNIAARKICFIQSP
jgi:hypothetical protein